MDYRPSRRLVPPLPLRDGVAPSYLWLNPGPWIRLLDFLVEQFPAVSREAWVSRMERGDVRDELGHVLTPTCRYRRNACIFYYRELDGETPIPFSETILEQDENLLVVDKPHFLPVIPGGRFLHETLLIRLRKHTGLAELSPIHRLDRETAGVVLFSVRAATRGVYQALFQHRLIEKEYEALAPLRADLQFPLVHRSRMVEGTPFFRMKEAPGLPNSETSVDLANRYGDIGLYRLRPLTGRKHQLRVHMAALGIPIINDSFYPHPLPCKGDDVSRPLKLLARSISFIDPLSGKPRTFSSERKL
jgi:tRNA pseudouridine32 synthase/23S rRNA pseudouridine746 synthase